MCEFYNTDVVDESGLNTVIAMIPSKKSDVFQKWMKNMETSLDEKSKQKAYDLFESGFIDEIEVAIHSDGRIARDVVCKEIPDKQCVMTADACTEGMVVEVETFSKDAVLDGDVHRRQFVLLLVMAGIDMTVHRHHLVQTP